VKRLTAAVLVLGVALPAAGQMSDGQHAAYRALIYTPVAGLPPLPPSIESLGRQGASRTAFTARVAHLSREQGLSLNTAGMSVDLPVNRWRLGGTFAYVLASCGQLWEDDSDCGNDFMVGGSARTTITTKPLGASAGRRTARSSDPTLVVGFEGSAGFSPRKGEQAMAIAVGLPTAIVMPTGTTRIMPFLTPGISYGRMGRTAYDEEETPTSYGSMMFLIGGGVGIQFGRSGLGTTVGFQKVLNGEGGSVQLGLGMTWQGLAVR